MKLPVPALAVTVPETGYVAGKLLTETDPLIGCVTGKFPTDTVPETVAVNQPELLIFTSRALAVEVRLLPDPS